MDRFENKEQIDVLPVLLAVLFIVSIFYLVRPTILMFWYYELGKAPHETVDEKPPGNLGETPITIQPPEIPASLEPDSMPERWSEKISIPTEMQILSDEITTLTSDERETRELQKLKTDHLLAEIATRHSKDMVIRNYQSHGSLDGDGPAQRVGMLHRRLFGVISENIAIDDSPQLSSSKLAAQLMDHWMNNLGNRRNILAERSTHVGVGCFEQQHASSTLAAHRCTQLFSKVYAYASEDIPATVTVGEKLEVSLISQPGFELPRAIVLIDLRTGQIANDSSGKRELQPMSMNILDKMATGSITFNVSPGVYGLSIHVPAPDAPDRYFDIPGPYIEVHIDE